MHFDTGWDDAAIERMAQSPRWLAAVKLVLSWAEPSGAATTPEVLTNCQGGDGDGAVSSASTPESDERVVAGPERSTEQLDSIGAQPRVT